MLELRPTCEHCNTALPPESPDARICSYECTFCADCVAHVLHDVCPNCGGAVAEDDTSCDFCGTQFALACPRCGAEVSASAEDMTQHNPPRLGREG